ncbi:cold shock domain-containing protein [Streptomyces sp. NPDC047000]|uniref:cold shock domain-containing protein n=1 Tax=Streptomyces sp. NPDC047000 TaxID=3155474 RepID=UPI0033C6C1B2
MVRFDSTRGYGFITPDHGQEDVFLHVNDLLIPEAMVRTGLSVEFEIEEGERGPKASSIRLAKGASSGRSVSSVPSVGGDDALCDVLASEDFTHDVTELLLHAVPSLTGQQLLQIRHELLEFAKKQGWIED